MQTIFFMALFSLVFSLMAGIIANGTSSSRQLAEARIADQKQYFDKVAKVVLNDISVEYLTANPKASTTIEDYINNLPQLKMLSDAHFANAAADVWGHALTGKIITEYQSLTTSSDTGNKVVVPVTGFLMVSSGPDGILQTTIPATLTLAQLYTVVVGTDANGKPLNDDIIYVFDNRKTQEEVLDTIKGSLNRIGIAARKQLEARTSTYRQGQATLYNQQIASGQEGQLSLLDLTNDPSAPRFLCLDTTITKGGCTDGSNNRKALGVDYEFDTLERTISGGGHFVTSAPAPATAADPLIISIQNDATKPTPWGNPSSSFKFQVQIKNTSS